MTRYYHVAWRDDRESILNNGLTIGPSGAVWFYTDIELAQKDSAGSDIWEAIGPPNVVPGYMVSAEWAEDSPIAASDSVPPDKLRLIELVRREEKYSRDQRMKGQTHA